MQLDNLHLAVKAAHDCEASPAQLAQVYVALRDCPEDVKTCAVQVGVFEVDNWVQMFSGVAALFFSVKEVMDADEPQPNPNAPPIKFDVYCNCAFCAAGIQNGCVGSGVQPVDADPVEQDKAQFRASILANEIEKFRKTLHSAATEAIQTAYTDYLPHIETDTESNIAYRVQGAINNLIAGKFEAIHTLDSDGVKFVSVGDQYGGNHLINLGEYSQLVKPIVDAFPDVLKDSRIKSLEAEVQRAMQWTQRSI